MTQKIVRTVNRIPRLSGVRPGFTVCAWVRFASSMADPVIPLIYASIGPFNGKVTYAEPIFERIVVKRHFSVRNMRRRLHITSAQHGHPTG
jgi:hypothetical protein